MKWMMDELQLAPQLVGYHVRWKEAGDDGDDDGDGDGELSGFTIKQCWSHPG